MVSLVYYICFDNFDKNTDELYVNHNSSMTSQYSIVNLKLKSSACFVADEAMAGFAEPSGKLKRSLKIGGDVYCCNFFEVESLFRLGVTSLSLAGQELLIFKLSYTGIDYHAGPVQYLREMCII